MILWRPGYQESAANINVFTRRSINRIQQHVQQTEGMARFRKVPQEQSELDSVSNSQQMLWRPICQESATNIPVERNQEDNSPNDVCEEICEWVVEQLD
ncbi:hypothetical protein AC249_AIPGENE28745 [Exaiptasia diaphana]|nr:hypothetical protein AC249_AIPGENE28745 [Exaiptasia diaphana]